MILESRFWGVWLTAIASADCNRPHLGRHFAPGVEVALPHTFWPLTGIVLRPNVAIGRRGRYHGTNVSVNDVSLAC